MNWAEKSFIGHLKAGLYIRLCETPCTLKENEMENVWCAVVKFHSCETEKILVSYFQ